MSLFELFLRTDRVSTQERIDFQRDSFWRFCGTAVTHTVEFNKTTVGNHLVNISSALTEEVGSAGAGQYEYGNGNVETVGQLILLDGSVHPDDFLGELHALWPDWPLR